jgi:FKBP-type peptidyl-prolyl cis-trans isomerase SlyD
VKIADKAFVSIDYALKLDSGEEIDKSEPGNPLAFVYSSGQVIPGLEKELNGKEAGFETEFTVEADDGYGKPRPELIRDIPRDRLPAEVDLKPGMAFQAEGPDGAVPFIIREVGDKSVSIDMNHPLCGERLHFKVKVLEVREATEEEKAAAAGCGHEGHECCDGCGESC